MLHCSAFDFRLFIRSIEYFYEKSNCWLRKTYQNFKSFVDKFPDGYDDSNIISFRNAKNELIEAVEVRTEDTIYLVKWAQNWLTELKIMMRMMK
jgi:hypothetical protein